MSNFDYAKAWFLVVLPAYKNLKQEQKNAIVKVTELTKDLRQGKNLNIPLNDEIKTIINTLTTKEIAEVSNISHALSHWRPSNIQLPTSWRVANCCDQILRERLNTPKNIRIHEGLFRITFSNRDCWLWENFALATEKNLEIFKKCKLDFGEENLKNNAIKLRSFIKEFPLLPALDAEVLNTLKETQEYREWKKAEKLKELLKSIEDAKGNIEKLQIEIGKKNNILKVMNDNLELRVNRTT